MIQTGIAHIGALMDEIYYQRCYEKVPQERREKADRLKNQKDKAQSIGAWLLLEQMKEKFGVCNAEVVFNLSHSGEYVLCSIEDCGRRQVKVGCDLEQIGKAKFQIAERFFCSGEQRWILERETEEERRRAFYRYWVLKESFMKAVRTGMALDMRRYEIAFDEKDIPFLKRCPHEWKGTYYFREYQFGDIPYSIAVCTTSEEISEELYEFTIG